jgi:hypothetical protein
MKRRNVAEGQKQHVDLWRKIALRKRLLSAAPTGNAYVPFIGDGDIACELYRGMTVYGADNDPARVATAKARLPEATILQADCDRFPFPGDIEFSLADFDAYSESYPAFLSFWKGARKANRLTLFFTDGYRQGIKRTGHIHLPDGTKRIAADLNERRRLYNFYWSLVVLPWFTEMVSPDWRVVVGPAFYTRKDQLYWGAVIERAK